MGKLTVTLPDALHQRIREELERQGITTACFIERAVTDFFNNQKGIGNMEKRTLAVQISEELYHRMKEYLARYEQMNHRKLSQKEFLIDLIEAKLYEEGVGNSPDSITSEANPCEQKDG